ncbi:MAG: GNAT family N-acetyltransferase [Burkholderiaceae bacterium]
MNDATLLTTERLVLRASDPSFAAAVADFYVRNAAPHARWNPPLGDAVYSAAAQAERLAEAAQAARHGSEIAWWLFARTRREPLIGRIHFSQITRRAFQNAMLGYGLDHPHEGRGLMHEALQAALEDAFGPRVGLHRVQANVRPENTRSLALLERLGFEREGLAREYLFIDGAWRDHVMTALRHPSWPPDAAPPATGC